MSGGSTGHIETGVDALAAAILAAGVAFCLILLNFPLPVSAAAAAVSFAGAFAGLRTIAPEAVAFAIPQLELQPLPAAEADELLLTDVYLKAEPEHSGELVLDDVLESLGPDSRVVRLFDPAAMPTPGQLKARIDRHLGADAGPPPDASQALHEALAELRRSLR